MAGASSSSGGQPAAQGGVLRPDAPAFVPGRPAGAPAAAGAAPGQAATPDTSTAAQGRPVAQSRLPPPPPPPPTPRQQAGGSRSKKAGDATPPGQPASQQKQGSTPPPQQKQQQHKKQQQQQQHKDGKAAGQGQLPAAGKSPQNARKGQAPSAAPASKQTASAKPSQGGRSKSGGKQKGQGAAGAAAAAAPLGGGGAPSAPSFAALPPDLLRRILAAVQPPSSAPAPLLQVAQQWFTLRLVCHSWAAVLEEVGPSAAALPVSVCAVVPVPGAVPWLHRHATSLRLAPPPQQAVEGPAGEADEALAWLQARCGRLHLAHATRGERNHPTRPVAYEYERLLEKVATGRQVHPGEPRSLLHYCSSLFLPLGMGKRGARQEGVLCQAVLDLSALTRLQSLDVSMSWGPSEDLLPPHTFDCAPLAHLPALHTLSLRGFAEPCLAGLPPGLRQLSIEGGWSRGGLYRPSAFFTLPPHSSLERVRVLGYQRAYISCALELLAMQVFMAGPEEYDELNAVQMFHDRRRFKVNLASLCGHSQEVITGAELLHLAQPGVQAARLDAQPPPVVPWGGGGSEYDSEEEEGGWQDEGEEEEEEEGPWPPGQASPWAPDQEMEVHLSHRDEDVAAAVEALAAAIGSGTTRLRRLQIRSSAFFVLRSGALVPAALLEQPAGLQALRERWPGVQLLPVPDRSLAAGPLLIIAGQEASPHWLVLTWPPSSGMRA